MSRGRSLLLLAGCALALAACGGGGSDATTTSTATLVPAGMQQPAGCFVTVFLTEDVTKDEIARIQSALLANRLVTQVSFVPKALVLKRFTQTNPAEARTFVYNPFSDRFEVVTRTRGGVFAIVGDFAIHGGPITNAKPSAGCSVLP